MSKKKTLKKEIKKEMYYANQIFRILYTATLQEEKAGIESERIYRIIYLEKLYRKYQKNRYYTLTHKKIRLEKSNVIIPEGYKKYRKKLKNYTKEDLKVKLFNSANQDSDKKMMAAILDEDIGKIHPTLIVLKSKLLTTYEQMMKQLPDILQKGENE